MEARWWLESWGDLLQGPELGVPKAGTLMEKLLSAELSWAQWWSLKTPLPGTCKCTLVWKKGLCEGSQREVILDMPVDPKSIDTCHYKRQERRRPCGDGGRGLSQGALSPRILEGTERVPAPHSPLAALVSDLPPPELAEDTFLLFYGSKFMAIC